MCLVSRSESVVKSNEKKKKKKRKFVRHCTSRKELRPLCAAFIRKRCGIIIDSGLILIDRRVRDTRYAVRSCHAPRTLILPIFLPLGYRRARSSVDFTRNGEIFAKNRATSAAIMRADRRAQRTQSATCI